MHASYVINSALFAVGYAKVLAFSRTSEFADPTITEAPQIDLELLRRQNSDRFIGWLHDSDGWESRQCTTGLTYFQSYARWACCTTTSTGCDLRTLPVGCVTGSLIYSLISATGTQQRTTIACTSIYNDPTDRSLTFCNTAYVYEYLQDKDPATRIVCGDSGENRSYYRQQPAEILTASTSSSSSSSPLTTSSSTTETLTIPPTISLSSLTVSQTAVSNPTPNEKKSQAWIAGAVVGPLAGFALVGGLIFFLIRRKKKNQTATPPPPTTALSYPGTPSHPLSPQPYYNYPPHMQQNSHFMVPYGAAGNVKHEDLGATPSSPNTQGSTSPHALYNPHDVPQLNPQPARASQVVNPPANPAPGYVDGHGVTYYPQANGQQPFSSELPVTYTPPVR